MTRYLGMFGSQLHSIFMTSSPVFNSGVRFPRPGIGSEFTILLQDPVKVMDLVYVHCLTAHSSVLCNLTLAA
jgi:hypothetical protein